MIPLADDPWKIALSLLYIHQSFGGEKYAAWIFMLYVDDECIIRNNRYSLRSYQVKVTEGIFQLQRQDVLLQWNKIQGKLGDIDIAYDSLFFQNLIAYEGPSGNPEYGKLMLNIAVLL